MSELNAINDAKNEVASLRNQILSVSQGKRDMTLGQSKNDMSFASIRTPPSQVTLRRNFKGHFGKITALHWGSDSRTLLSASQDGNLIVWNAVANTKLQVIPLKSYHVMSCAIEPTQQNLVACGGLDNLCTIYSRSNPSGTGAVGASTNSNLNSSTTSATGLGGGATAAKPITEMANHDGFISCCRFLNPNEILTSSGDSTITRWDIERSQPLNIFMEHQSDVMFLSLQPGSSNNVFASCSIDKTCKVWDIRTPTSSVHSLSGYHIADINGIEFVPCDPNVFVTASQDNTVRVFDVRTMNELNSFGHSNGNNTTTNSKSNTATATPNSNIDGGVGEDMVGYMNVACSKSGRLIFAGHGDGSIDVFDILASTSSTGSTSLPPPTYKIHNAHNGTVACLGSSPYGDAICSGGWDKTLKIWA